MTIGEKFNGFIETVTSALNNALNIDDGDGPFIFEEEDGNAVRKPIAYTTEPVRSGSKRERDNVAAFPGYKGYAVMIVEPRSFGEAGQIVEHLLEKKTVVLNLHLLDKEQSQRTIDFICGAAHALEGTARKVGETVFIFTPNNVALSEEVQVQSKLSTEAYWDKKPL